MLPRGCSRAQGSSREAKASVMNVLRRCPRDMYVCEYSQLGARCANVCHPHLTSVPLWFELERDPQSSVRVKRIATMGGTSVQKGDGLGPSPFAPPPKRQRVAKEPEAYCVSDPQTCLNYAYCYHEYHDLTDPRWDCEICGAHFLLIGTSERCRDGAGRRRGRIP